MKAADGSLYVFAGVLSEGQLSDEIFKLDVLHGQWTRLEFFGPQPSARAYHATVALGYKIVVFGGLTSTGDMQTNKVTENFRT